MSLQKQHFLKTFLDKYDPDIVLISKTKLNPKRKIEFKNHNIIRVDTRTNAILGGGTAILIKNTFSYKQIKTEKLGSFNTIESAAISLNLINKQKLILVSIYAPDSQNDVFVEELDNLFNVLNLDKFDTKYIIAGNMKTKHINWNNVVNNSRGNSLNHCLQNNNVKYKPELL